MPAKILIVEDYPNNRQLLKDVLEHHGYTVLESANGADGLKIAKADRPDLILLDIQMPFLDGYEVLRRLREDPELADIKVVAVTSFAMKGDREKAFAAGFSGHWTKPLDIKILPAEVKKLLGP